MSIRNLEHVFQPRSVALIGASKTPRSVGQRLAYNLFNAGFDGPIMPVHPRERAIEGVLTYPSIEDLPVVPDLAVIDLPPPELPDLIRRLGARGTRAAIVVPAGFAELGKEGERLQQALLDACKAHTLRIIGPNSVGVMVPGFGLNASFAHRQALNGDLAFISQSGGVLTSVLDWASARGIGFSHMVSLGGMADVDFGDMLDYLATDPRTRAILLHMESVTNARKFMSAARAAARSKPVVVIKGGVSEEAARAAFAHTGRMAGEDAVFDAAVARAGMLRVTSLEELFAAVSTLNSGLRVNGDRVVVISNGGGVGVLATDALIADGGHLATLQPATIDTLNTKLTGLWSGENPIDLGESAAGPRYAAALEAVLADPGNDAIVVLGSPSAVVDGTETARAVVDAAKTKRSRPVLTSWLGETAAAEARRIFTENRIPTYATPSEAMRGLSHAVRFRRNQEMLRQVPPSVADVFAPNTERAQQVLDQAMESGHGWLNEVEAKALIEAYGVPCVPTHVVTSPDQAAEVAASLARPVALKIVSPDIVQKSKVGGLMLGLTDPWKVYQAARTILENIKLARPDARIEGLSVQPMAEIEGAHELLIAVTSDPNFGPVIRLGSSEAGSDAMRESACALPPLNMPLAHALIRSAPAYRALRGQGGRPPVALEAIALTLVKVSQLITDLDRVAELQIHPLRVDEHGVLGLDARVRVADPLLRHGARLAIRPYPKQLEREIAIRSGKRYFIRPIRPEDAPLLTRFVDERTTPEDRRLRFFTTFRTLAPELCARLTQIDYEREIALVAIDPEAPSDDSFRGVVRLAADPDRQRAEYAVLVASDLKGQGLGSALMNAIIEYGREQGVGEIYGTVLSQNRGMLDIAERLGFERHRDPGDMEIVEVRLPLTQQAA